MKPKEMEILQIIQSPNIVWPWLVMRYYINTFYDFKFFKLGFYADKFDTVQRKKTFLIKSFILKNVNYYLLKIYNILWEETLLFFICTQVLSNFFELKLIKENWIRISNIRHTRLIYNDVLPNTMSISTRVEVDLGYDWLYTFSQNQGITIPNTYYTRH